MTSEVVKSLISDDGQSRLEIVRKRDTYTAFDYVRAQDCDGEPCWTPAWPSAVDGMVTDSAELAESEARTRLNW